MTSPYLTRPIRTLDQVTGRNVVPFPPRKEPWPYEAGAEPPKFLTEKIKTEPA
jgi:hypothetical protein